jgi:hypothetical protein
MKRRERYIARPDEVTVTRDGDSALIQYVEKGIPGTNLTIGPRIHQMTDEEIVEMHNECLREQTRLAASYRHVAIETPLGSPQIQYEERSNQWCPRGAVLRCQIMDDENGELVVGIDDQELTLEAFGRMLTTYAGWGMRIEFVPDDAVHRRPAHEVRKPTEES